MGYSTLDAAYIIDIDGGGSFKFQFIPASITDTKSNSPVYYSILGRSSPLSGYATGTPRSLSFTVVMFADPTADGPKLSTAEIKKRKDWLLSLPYPDYGGGLKPPHRCFINIGDDIKFVGQCTTASAIYQGKPWDLGPGLPHGVEVSLTFEECLNVPVDLNDRRSGSPGDGYDQGFGQQP